MQGFAADVSMRERVTSIARRTGTPRAEGESLMDGFTRIDPSKGKAADMHRIAHDDTAAFFEESKAASPSGRA